MMKKVLYIATSDIHLEVFHLPYIKWFNENGYCIDLAAENRNNILFPNTNHFFNILFPRSLFSRELFKSYKELKRVIHQGQYHLIHCHTPIPSFLTRLAARHSRKKGTKVLYTAHGFHFYKGAPLVNWVLYYTAVYILSYYTDGIITINKEDYGYVHEKMLNKESYCIKGIGINTLKFQGYPKQKSNILMKSIGVDKTDFILLYIAEFINRKNHKFIIECIKSLKERIPTVCILFVGSGPLVNEMVALSKDLGVEKYIRYLGFQSNVEQFISIADIGISSSRHEGLGLGLAEEMFCSLPVVATFDKGHKELIDNGINGFMYAHGDKNGFVDYVVKLYNSPSLRMCMGREAHKKAQDFTIDKSLISMEGIYNKYLSV